MEACCGAHHLGRLFAAQGHEVRLMSPEYVRPHVKSQKNDDLDAEAIAEAATRPTMRFVEVKSQTQSGIQALHRARERLVSERTALINHLRALLLERGIVAPQGRRKLEEELSVFADEDGIEALSPRILARAHKNVAVVALANKLARIAWAILARGCAYDAGYEMVSA